MWSLIAAVDRYYGIGYRDGLPWHFSADMRHFVSVTQGKNVLFGRKTWQSLPRKAQLRLRPRAYVLQRDLNLTLPGDIIVCGGAEIYRWAFQNHRIDTLYLTRIHGGFNCDVFFPKEYLHWYKQESETKLVCFNHFTDLSHELSFETWRLKDADI